MGARKINRSQKLAISFILLGTSFIAGGLALNEIIEHSHTYGGLSGLACQIIALVFAIKWYRDKRVI